MVDMLCRQGGSCVLLNVCWTLPPLKGKDTVHRPQDPNPGVCGLEFIVLNMHAHNFFSSSVMSDTVWGGGGGGGGSCSHK